VFERTKQWLSFSSDPGIVIAQYGELKRQIPLLYALLILNASAVSYTHYEFAPKFLTLGSTGLLILISAFRIASWTFFSESSATVTADRAREMLRRTTLTSAPICVVFISWALILDRYGGPFEHAHVAVFIAITVIGCIFCLVHLPQAALLVNVTVTVPYLIYYLVRGNPVFVAMALNIALVTGVMMRVLLNSFAGFTKLIRSQASLAAQQAEAQRLGEDNARLALTDVLTGLPNRRFFFARLDALLRERKASGERFAVGVLDLDRFKLINDAYGHVVGDRLLVDVARRLADLSDSNIIIARLGGDEFGLLLTDDIDQARARGQHICDLLSRPFEIDDHQLSFGCSGGLAIFPDAGTTANELFDRSDYALYNMKSTRRGGCALFSADHETRIRSERAMEAALQAADLEAELHVEFQPILCLDTMKVLSVEALGRWINPTVGSVEPSRFIITAERIGLMHPITIALFRKALAGFDAIPVSIGLSFNLSAHDIVSPETIDMLVETIEQAGVDPARVTFELTETALMRDFDAAVIGINRLRGLGIAIALDDFGMGYSSLSYLNRLPLDKVKVDRSFISDMDEDSGRKIIAAILGLCGTLELDCIIEGVESDMQLQQVRSLGYRMAQGYLFARPMTLPALLIWLDGAGAVASKQDRLPGPRRARRNPARKPRTSVRMRRVS
jgi:diguanylate cyclase (GGDEF)-like protein